MTDARDAASAPDPAPTPALLQSPLHDEHLKHGASMVDFAGWAMPIRYRSIREEHVACRTGCAMFDVSHMGRVRFTGKDAAAMLDRVMTRRTAAIPQDRCRYALVCNEQGGVMDDIIASRCGDEAFLLVVNASNRAKLLEHFRAVGAGFPDCKIDDETTRTAMVAIQGPQAMDLVGRFSDSVAALKRYAFVRKSAMGADLMISRTGYTGEDGVEIILPAKHAKAGIKLLLGDASATVTPCGLGARDSLRTEAAMPLYGHELDEATNPLAAGLGFAVDLSDKFSPPTFIGAKALLEVEADGPQRKLVGLSLNGRRTPRQGAKVFTTPNTEGEIPSNEIGIVTSGCLSPTLEHPIAMAYCNADQATVGQTVQIDIGRQFLPATVVELPFYKRSK